MHTRSFFAASALLLGVLGCRDDAGSPTEPAVTNTAAAVSDTWITRKDLWSNQFGGFATATVPNAAGQSIVYVIGGRTATGASLSKVMAYNVTTNIWNSKAPLPVPLYDMNGAAVINGKIYVSGGLSADKVYSEALYVYDPATNVWTRKRNMPLEGGGGIRGVSGVIAGKLYVLTNCLSDYCGIQGGLFRYNPSTDRWVELAPLYPHYCGGNPYMAGGTVGGNFYVTCSGRLWMYDPATNQWNTKASIPVLGDFGVGTTLRAQLYVFGWTRSTSDAPWMPGTLVYTPSTDSWAVKAPMPTLRSVMSASKIMVKGQPRIEVVGGPRPGNNLQYIP